jgi:hypothetical protein
VTTDGRHVVSSGNDGTVRVWNVDGHVAVVLSEGPIPIVSVAPNRDASVIAVVDRNGRVRQLMCDACGPRERVAALARSRWVP